jgi:hypothetical protein
MGDKKSVARSEEREEDRAGQRYRDTAVFFSLLASDSSLLFHAL